MKAVARLVITFRHLAAPLIFDCATQESAEAAVKRIKEGMENAGSVVAITTQSVVRTDEIVAVYVTEHSELDSALAVSLMESVFGKPR